MRKSVNTDEETKIFFPWSDHKMYVAPWQNWFELGNSNKFSGEYRPKKGL